MNLAEGSVSKGGRGRRSYPFVDFKGTPPPLSPPATNRGPNNRSCRDAAEPLLRTNGFHFRRFLNSLRYS